MNSNELFQKLEGVVSVIPQQYVEAILFLHQKWDSLGVEWIINGKLAEVLRIVNTMPDCIEVVCSKADEERLFEATKDLNPTPLSIQITQLPNAVYEGNQYPVYTKSHYFEFTAKGIPVKVHGDLQFKVNDWEWGDTFEVEPEYVSVVGSKTAVTPLPILYQLYSDLGWAEPMQRLQRVLQRRAIRH